jgi:protein-S-isoprenylcysteine O-methyltransferase Ste14
MNYLTIISGTIVIIFLSWIISVKHKRYHGVARFFSFESIYILFLFNYRVWFLDPFSHQQVISWILLILSLYFAVDGFLLLRRIGKPDSNFENTSVLVKNGLYKYIRHPLYLSLFLLGTGIMFKNPGLKQICLGLLNLGAVCITARIEEKEMIARFGEDYITYMKETWMFIPYIL